MKTLSISQVQRELHLLNSFDIVEIVDKKRDEVKGYFVDKKYKKLIESIIKEDKKKSLSKFAGMWEDRDISQEDLRAKAWKE